MHKLIRGSKVALTLLLSLFGVAEYAHAQTKIRLKDLAFVPVIDSTVTQTNIGFNVTTGTIIDTLTVGTGTGMLCLNGNCQSTWPSTFIGSGTASYFPLWVSSDTLGDSHFKEIDSRIAADSGYTLGADVIESTYAFVYNNLNVGTTWYNTTTGLNIAGPIRFTNAALPVVKIYANNDYLMYIYNQSMSFGIGAKARDKDGNIAIGYMAGTNVNGANIGIGRYTLNALGSGGAGGANNTAVGDGALADLTESGGNSAFGAGAGGLAHGIEGVTCLGFYTCYGTAGTNAANFGTYVGYRAAGPASYGVALGAWSRAIGTNSVAIGHGVYSPNPYTTILANYLYPISVGINTSTTTATLSISSPSLSASEYVFDISTGGIGATRIVSMTGDGSIVATSSVDAKGVLCINGDCRSSWGTVTGGDVYLAHDQTYTGRNTYTNVTEFSSYVVVGSTINPDGSIVFKGYSTAPTAEIGKVYFDSSTLQLKLSMDGANYVALSTSTGGGVGDVTLAGDNPFTGYNTFSKAVAVSSAVIANAYQISGSTVLAVLTSSTSIAVGNTQSNTTTSAAARDTLVGHNAGRAITSGFDNTFLGAYAGERTTTGDNNISIGAGAGTFNTSGQYTVAIGGYANHNHTSNIYSVLVGQSAGENHTTGISSTFLGAVAGQYLVNGSYNTAVGAAAMHQTVRGSGNTIIGEEAAPNFIVGSNNSVLGYYAGYHMTTSSNVVIGANAGEWNYGNGSVFVGYQAGNKNTYGDYNTFLGYQAGFTNAGDYDYDTFVGYQAGYASIRGLNSCLGYQSCVSNTTGINDTYIGVWSGRYNTTGSSNTVTGFFAGHGALGGTTYSGATLYGNQAGYNLTTGANNILIGPQAGYNVTTGSNNIIIGVNQNAPAANTNSYLNIGNTLFGDLANANIGVGIPSPSQKLDVNGNTAMAGTLISSGTGTSIFIGSGTVGGTWDVTGDVFGSNISHNFGVRDTVTITDAGSSNISISSTSVGIRDNAYSTGKLYTKIIAANASLALTDNAINFIYVTWNSGTPIYAATTDRSIINNSDIIAVARVEMSGSAIKHILLNGNTALDQMAQNLDRIMRIRGQSGFEKESGLTVSCSTTSPTIGSGYLFFGNKRFTLGAYDTATYNNMYIYTHSGGSWIETNSNSLVNSYYDNGTSTVSLNSNRYVVNYLYRLVSESTNMLAVVVSTGDFTLAQALASAGTIPATPDDFSWFYYPVGSVIMQNAATTPTLVTTYNPSSGVSYASVMSHGDLLNLGADDHPQYLLKSGGTMTGTLDMGGQPIINVSTVTTTTVNNFVYFADTEAKLTSVLAAASITGGVVNIASGTYTGTWSASGVTIRGAGIGKTVLKMPDLTAGHVFIAGSSTTISDMTIDGNKVNQSSNTGGSGILLSNAIESNSYFHDIEIMNTINDGFQSYNSTRFVLERLDIHDVVGYNDIISGGITADIGYSGVKIQMPTWDQAAYVTLRDIHSYNNGLDGVEALASYVDEYNGRYHDNGRAQNFSIHSLPCAGFFSGYPAHHITNTGTKVWGNNGNGLDFDRVSYRKTIAVESSSNGLSGIYSTDYSSYTEIIGGSFYNNDTTSYAGIYNYGGIYDGGGTGHVITGAKCFNNPTNSTQKYGIYLGYYTGLPKLSSSTISGNICSENLIADYDYTHITNSNNFLDSDTGGEKYLSYPLVIRPSKSGVSLSVSSTNTSGYYGLQVSDNVTYFARGASYFDGSGGLHLGLTSEYSGAGVIDFYSTDNYLYGTTNLLVIVLGGVERMRINESTVTAYGKIHIPSSGSGIVFSDGTTQYTSRTKYVATSSMTVSGTGETSMFSTTISTGSLTLPANYFSPGRVIRVTIRGLVSTTASAPDGTIRIKLGSTEIFSGTVTLPANLTSMRFKTEIDISCSFAGASGTVVAEGESLIQTAPGLSTPSFRGISGAETTVDTTASQALDVTYQFSATGNSLVIKSATVEGL